MRLVVLRDWTRTYDPALRVQAGQRVTLGKRDDLWPGWVWCTPESGPSGWLPDHLFTSDGRVRADYDTREITVTRGDLLDLLATDPGWHLCRTTSGEQGWVPESHCAPCPEGEVFICQSLDGFIADAEGSVDWLLALPQEADMGYPAFIARMDAILMGRASYETVAAFADWPYQCPVILLSRSRTEAPPHCAALAGTLPEALALAAESGWHRLYIDGGETIRSAVALGIVTRITLTTAPLLLGEGRPLFGGQSLPLRLVATNPCAHGFTQAVYDL